MIVVVLIIFMMLSFIPLPQSTRGRDRIYFPQDAQFHICKSVIYLDRGKYRLIIREK